MPTIKRKSFSFNGEDDRKLDRLVSLLKTQSPVKVSQIEALRYAMETAIERLEHPANLQRVIENERLSQTS